VRDPHTARCAGRCARNGRLSSGSGCGDSGNVVRKSATGICVRVLDNNLTSEELAVNSFLLSIDRISAWVGKAFAWTIVLLTVVVGYEVIVRKLGAPTNWAFDVSSMLFGVLFMMAGAYTLSRNGHVRGDLLYRTLSPRSQAWMDLVLYIAFFIPGIAALFYAGWEFAGKSWAIKEASSVTGSGLPVYPFKAIIPVAGAFLLLQALAEMIRCVLCIRTGRWPGRLHDVEEADVEQLKTIVQAVDLKGVRQ